MMAALLLTSLAMPMHAQVYKDTDSTPKERVSRLLKDTRKGMKKAGKTISDFFEGFNLSDEERIEEVKVGGVKYMRLHTVNLFEGDDEGMAVRSREEFLRRYPRCTVVAVAIPQQKWKDVAQKEDGKIVAYTRKADCYVLGKDGKDGYINVLFSFRCTRKPGGEWVRPAEYWPRLVRVDAIPNVHFEELNHK